MSALQYHQIAHRNVAAEHIFIDEAGNLTVSGFEDATLVSPDIMMTEKCGTPGYMAPEVLSLRVAKEGYTTAVDVWGFGMVLFEMITGKVRILHTLRGLLLI